MNVIMFGNKVFPGVIKLKGGYEGAQSNTACVFIRETVMEGRQLCGDRYLLSDIPRS